MLKWELKKIIKDKNSIIALVLMIVLFLVTVVVKPVLETENNYFDDSKNQFVTDNRDGQIIANEKLQNKIEIIKGISNQVIDTNNKQKEELQYIKDMASEKLVLDKGSKYENINFYKAFNERIDFPLIIMIMMIIIVMISSNLYTQEEIANVSPIILSSKNKKKVLNSKLFIAILLPILLYAVYILANGLITYIQYGQPLNGDLQAYRILDNVSLVEPISISLYTMKNIADMLLILIGTSVISFLSSVLSNNSAKAMVLSVGFIGIGKILTLFKFLPTSVLAVLSAGNYVDIMMGTSKISGIYNGTIDILSMPINISHLCIGIYGLIVILGILGSFYSFKKVLTK